MQLKGRFSGLMFLCLEAKVPNSGRCKFNRSFQRIYAHFLSTIVFGIEGDENALLTVSGILVNKKSKGQPQLVALGHRHGYRSLKAEILIGRD